MLSTYGDCVNRYIDRGTMCCIKVIWKHFQIDLVCYSLSGESGCRMRMWVMTGGKPFGAKVQRVLCGLQRCFVHTPAAGG